MRVLLASPQGNISGGIARWTKHVLQYYSSLTQKDIELEWFDTARSVNICEGMSTVQRILLGIKDYAQTIKKLKKKVSSKKFDVLHLTTSASWGLIKDLFFIRIARRNGIKTAVHFRFGRTPELSVKRNWEWKLLCRVVSASDVAVFIDKASYSTMQNLGFRNVKLLPNPITPRVFELVEKIGDVAKHNREVLFVGHCLKAKGVFELVQACKMIGNVKVKMVGSVSEDLRNELLQLAENAMQIEIVGEEPYGQIIKDMLQCDVFALPSYTEGFPNVILEAMACGCAIVATDVGAIPEMLEEEDGKMYGLIVKPKNTEQLKMAIEEMFNNQQLKQDCSTNARRRVEERYSMPQVWNQMTYIWNSL